MFFIIGITPGRKALVYELMVRCPHCGKWERCQIQMTFTCLDFFFIPLFKWDKRYLLKMHCCNSVFELDGEIGKLIVRKEEPEILPQHLTLLKAGTAIRQEPEAPPAHKAYGEDTRVCPYCGEPLAAPAEACPKCAKPLKWA